MKTELEPNEALVLVPGAHPACLYTHSRVLVVAGAKGRKVLWEVDRLTHTRPGTYRGAVSRIELFWLALSLLGICRRAMLAQAKAFLATRFHRSREFYSQPLP